MVISVCLSLQQVGIYQYLLFGNQEYSKFDVWNVELKRSGWHLYQIMYYQRVNKILVKVSRWTTRVYTMRNGKGLHYKQEII